MYIRHHSYILLRRNLNHRPRDSHLSWFSSLIEPPTKDSVRFCTGLSAFLWSSLCHSLVIIQTVNISDTSQSTRLNHDSLYEIIQLWMSLCGGPACGHADLEMSGIFLYTRIPSAQYSMPPRQVEPRFSLPCLIPPTLPLSVRFMKECPSGRKERMKKGDNAVWSDVLSEEEGLA